MNVLILAPHSDDESLGCGGTIAKHVEAGDNVHTIVFSTCGRADLSQEATAASLVLGSTLEVLNFTVRQFGAQRQEILDYMVKARERYSPDIVYMPCSTDIHQDHKVINEEGFRAFKHCTVLGYELPWNCRSFDIGMFVALTDAHIQKRITAVQQYKSQEHRAYTQPPVIVAHAQFRGLQAGSYYAEAFEVIRYMA